MVDGGGLFLMSWRRFIVHAFRKCMCASCCMLVADTHTGTLGKLYSHYTFKNKRAYQPQDVRRKTHPATARAVPLRVHA